MVVRLVKQGYGFGSQPPYKTLGMTFLLSLNMYRFKKRWNYHPYQPK